MSERQPTEVEALMRVIEEVRHARDEDRRLLDELRLALVTQLPAVPATGLYPDWITWVDEWLTPRISRSHHRVRWCTHYAEHPEVADRLEALWHAWETTWAEPERRVSWYRDGLDHQLAIMTADDGPLRECSAHEGVHDLPSNLGDGPRAVA